MFDWLRRVDGVTVSNQRHRAQLGRKRVDTLAALFDELNAWASNEGLSVVIAFDEAQELKKVAGVDMPKFSRTSTTTAGTQRLC